MRINSKIKLILYNNEKIIIENYQELRDISEETIVVDFYQVVGSFLKLKRMDNYMIEIYGKISQITINK